MASVVENPPASAEDTRDVGLIPGTGRSPGGGNDTPLQYCCLENSMDRGNNCPWDHKGVAHNLTVRWLIL